jgi:proline dehydrogenase
MLYIDAEQTFMQSTIESFGQQLTHKYNRGEKHIIMNGYQQYLKRMREVIPFEIATSQELGYNLGIKLIRGAYMNEERKLAAENHYESPIWDTLEETHNCYNTNLQLVMNSLTKNSLLMVACHNVESVKLAQNKIAELGIDDCRVRFAQLKGFSDQLTVKLSQQQNLKVYKYLPYGPTETVMPYLVRRGQESK